MTFVVKSLPSVEMDTVIQVQILDEAVSISHSANIIGKGIHPTLLLLAIDK